MFKTEKKYYFWAFAAAFAMALFLLLPFVVFDSGYFVYYGDFNAQQIPFYKTCMREIKSGNFGWSWQTDMGVNFIGSYSFYTLGSPFFWLAVLFPVSVSQYLMAPLLALKLGLCSFFAFVYLRRFVTKPINALIGGILYAFSGYSMNNIFFNHFHEAMVFFPLLLIGLEETVVNKRRGALALAVAINAFVNYFFFIGECVFLVIYFVGRIAGDKAFRIKFRDFVCLAFESVCGVLLAGILFVPSIFQVLDVPRSTNFLLDWNFLFYNPVQRYGLILEAMFFPGEIPARSYMFPDANAKWASVAIYIPLFSMSGVFAFIHGIFKGLQKQMKWLCIVLMTCLVFVFVPGLNSSFMMFNQTFYTRWFYMPSLLCSLATVYCLEHEEFDLKLGVKFTASVTVIMTLLVVFLPTKAVHDEDLEKGLVWLPNAFNTIVDDIYINIGVALATLAIMISLLSVRNKKPAAEFPKWVLTLTITCSLILGYYYVLSGRILGPYKGEYNSALEAEIDIDDSEFFRMEETGGTHNTNMLWDMYSMKSFHSIIPSSTLDLYELLNVERSVNSVMPEDKYAIRSLAGVKYLFAEYNMVEEVVISSVKQYKVFEPCGRQDNYFVFKNESALPMGYAYDSYILNEKVKKSAYGDNLMVGSVALSPELAEKYSDILTPGDPPALSGDKLYEQFLSDIEDRKALAVKDFKVNGSSFSAVTDYDRERLVVFAVPYDRGWSGTATLSSGETITLEPAQVNGGFIGVRVPAGECRIEFNYTTPGLKLGIYCTLAGAGMFGVYVLIVYVFVKRKPKKYAHLYGQNQLEGVSAHNNYVSELSQRIFEAPEKGSPDLSARELTADEIKAKLSEITQEENENRED